MQELTISLLGAPAIAVDGVSIQVDTRKAVALVAYLALNPGVQARRYTGCAALARIESAARIGGTAAHALRPQQKRDVSLACHRAHKR